MYIPLKNHTPYSLLEGAIFISDLLDFCKAHHMKAVGIADTSHLFGAMEFSLAAIKQKIQPLIGVQLCIEDEGDLFWLTYFAKNQQGYQNLCRLVTASTRDQDPLYKGCVSLKWLAEKHEGLLVLTGGYKGPLHYFLEKGQRDKANNMMTFLQNLYQDHLYVEIDRSQPNFQIEETLIEWAYAQNLPCIATNEAFFLKKENHEAHDALRCIALGRYVQEVDRPRLSVEHYLKTQEEMQALFHDLPEALEQTDLLRQRCHFVLETAKPMLPYFSKEESEEELLSKQAQKGLEERLSKEVLPFVDTALHEETRKAYRERLDYELKTIIQMGFAGYFLIVSDFICFAKNNEIPVGPGRGSGASSLVAFVLRITDVDPLKFGLFFERFLNPERVSLPDFDVDFCQERRDEVIDYVASRYGREKVAHIITFGTLQARAALRDVGRVLQMPYSQVDKICKMIPAQPGIDLKEALKIEPQLLKMASEEEEVFNLLKIGQQLEGLYRHASTHAAGVVIGQSDLTDVLPLYQDSSASLPATEFSMKYAEAIGLIKFDFLGLKTLTVLKKTIDLLKERGIFLDLLHIPLDDAKTFDLLKRAETVGLFQIESAGMTEVLRQLQPERFEEIIALVALYRPGPMDDIPRYIACRHQREKVTYPYPGLEDILQETFGVMTYQEQVLQIARKLAGYTLGEADLLRRAMGKKIPAEMQMQREKFVDGVLKSYGGNKETAIQLFEQIAKFAGYAFPKAHAVPYALISYQTAYLKANYPVEFMCALMCLDFQNTDKLRVFTKEVKRMGVSLWAPDVRFSEVSFSVQADSAGNLGIRYGLSALKNVGEGAMQALVAENKRKPFENIYDFCERAKDLNKKNLEGLIYGGALDSFGIKRHVLIESMGILLAQGQKQSGGQGAKTLFAKEETEPLIFDAKPWTIYQKLNHEREALGFYLTAHPLEDHFEEPFILYEDALQKLEEKSPLSLQMAGVIMDLKERVSKAGHKFAILSLSDPSQTFEVLCFSKVLQQSRELLKIGSAVTIHLQARKEGEQIRLSAESFGIFKPPQQKIDVYIYHTKDLEKISGFLGQKPTGSYQVFLHLCLEKGKICLKIGDMDLSKEELAFLKENFGLKNLKKN